MKNKVFKTLQLFGFDNNDYCNFYKFGCESNCRKRYFAVYLESGRNTASGNQWTAGINY